ncbi:hypothetical protein GQ600_410 [Phytophthora cactorum]|nr:hypothetical protein GQ600_410 [Phytophthora cactorum]
MEMAVLRVEDDRTSLEVWLLLRNISGKGIIDEDTTQQDLDRVAQRDDGEESSQLILLSKHLVLILGSLGRYLLVVLLQSSKVLTSLRELSFLHTLTDVPVNERTLRVHQVELVVDTREHLGDSTCIRDHAHSTLHTSQITTRHNRRGLVINATFETRGAPVHELDSALGLDGGHRGVHILGDDVATIHEARRHVLAVTWVTLGHHGGGLKSAARNLGDRKCLVVGLLGRDDGGVRAKHEVDARVRHQVGLELGDINIKRAIESKRRRQGRNHLCDQSVEVRVGRSLDVQRSKANVVDSLIVKHNCNICVLKKSMSREHRVVWLYDSHGKQR